MRKIDESNGFIDIVVTDKGKLPSSVDDLFIEYKWYGGENTVSKQLFLDEFVTRDLHNIEDLRNLQWRIKGQKLTKDKVIEYLSSLEGRELLDKQKTIKLMDNYANSIGYSKEVTNVNEMLEFMKNNNDWYSLIFK